MKGIFSNIAAGAALLITLSWPAHEAFVHGGQLQDNDCQMCSVSLSPELNADCGGVPLPAPDGFVIVESGQTFATVPLWISAPYRGRAPPSL